ncbi:hypothetical protein RhiirA4_461652 [Rhizophagus irregularis]|uniref:BTB domain-containing protein n=1 Tax=Rhizophagus irregularis TaxID=588596 RepID=A0A2I1GJA8_9GLOM|nr:hypothetical protein RhiirA4_461652 [Rhizophagus irregularis]
MIHIENGNKPPAALTEHDMDILCKDEKKLYGCRAILVARSEVLEGLLNNGMKESFEGKISFPAIDSSGMRIYLCWIT